MDIVLLCLFGFVLLSSLWSALRDGADDADWEFRLRALGDNDRARFAAAGLPGASRAGIGDPGEPALVEGFNRRERRRRAYVYVVATAILVAVLALAQAGVLPHSFANLFLVAWAVFQAAALSLRDRQIKRRARPATKPAATTVP